jgi:N-acylneuraminate cytidylyltransferase
MKVYFLIPARGGSKGIPKKNIKLFADKPLIYWSIEQSLKSKYCNRVFLTTDSEEIRQIGISLGVEAPFLRPEEISQDTSNDHQFIEHFVNYLIENKLDLPDLIVQMRPTYPTRKVNLIDEMIEKFIDKINDFDSLRTIIENDRTPYKMYRIDDNKNNLIPLFEEVDNIKEPYNQCRQILPKTYLHNGYIDIIKTKSFLENKSITGKKILPFLMNKEEIDDIDTIEEWAIAEKKFMNQ